MPETRSKLMLSDKVLRLIPDERVARADYLGTVLQSEPVRHQIASSLSGSTGQANISQEAVLNLRVPKKSVDEQRRIVEVLGAVDERILLERVLLAKRQKVQEGALGELFACHRQQFRASRLMYVSKGPGDYGSSASAVERYPGLPRYVRITDIDDYGRLTQDPGSVMSVPLAVGRRYLLSEGDLLLARTGFTTGKSYLYRAEDGFCSFAGYLVRFRIDPDKMFPAYAFFWTRSRWFKGWVARNVREVGQRNISAAEYNLHEVPVPPLEVQEDVVRLGEGFQAELALREREIDQLMRLKQALTRDLIGG
ncbi:restriction endonuclease subunit S [Streptomyces sp. AcE210]|uniref:restriction endonuclease subunit S n=1 Tax=Streptomyces sp. AcE210 TaxID=2292703 RepID=UPI001058AD36|nr:restriction endonuclease subunit S [Streptomyces sp. AcE210]